MNDLHDAEKLIVKVLRSAYDIIDIHFRSHKLAAYERLGLSEVGWPLRGNRMTVNES